MAFQDGDKVTVNGEKGRGEGTVVGRDPVSGMLQIRFDAVEAKDDKGQTVQASGMGYAPDKQVRKRRKS